MDEILVNFDYFQHSGVFGIGFRGIIGVLQPFFLQGSLESHQGHWGNGVVLSCTSLFEVNQKPFSAIFHLMNLMEEVSKLFEEFQRLKTFREVWRAIRAIGEMELY